MTISNALCGANRAILQHKAQLLSGISSQFGSADATKVYTAICPIVAASIGQHVRHSLDHISRALEDTSSFHYDQRSRKTADEEDIEAALNRIQHLQDRLDVVSMKDHQAKVTANFMLTADGPEIALPSTRARELGFVVHHAIHHLAMIRIICQQHDNIVLPSDFGRAPSTVQYDQAQ